MFALCNGVSYFCFLRADIDSCSVVTRTCGVGYVFAVFGIGDVKVSVALPVCGIFNGRIMFVTVIGGILGRCNGDRFTVITAASITRFGDHIVLS